MCVTNQWGFCTWLFHRNERRWQTNFIKNLLSSWEGNKNLLSILFSFYSFLSSSTERSCPTYQIVSSNYHMSILWLVIFSILWPTWRFISHLFVSLPKLLITYFHYFKSFKYNCTLICTSKPKNRITLPKVIKFSKFFFSFISCHLS